MKSKQAGQAPQKKTPIPVIFYCRDGSGMVHFGRTPEEAQFKTAASNRALKIQNKKEGL